MNNLQKTQAIIFDFNRTLYDPETGMLLPYAKEILEYSILNHDCYLISYKENDRLDLFKALGIAGYFKKMKLVPEKTEEEFKNIFGDQQYEKVFVVGDRRKGEITIGNKLGYITIWLRRGKFKDEISEFIHEKPWHTVTSLQELKNIL